MRYTQNKNEVVISYTLIKLTLCVGYLVGYKVGGLYVGSKVWAIEIERERVVLAEGIHSNIFVVTSGSRQH